MSRRNPFPRRGNVITWAQDIARLSWQFRASRALMAAHRTGVFRRLSRSPARSATVAADLHLDPDMTERVLIACAAMDLVQRQSDAWALTPKAQATLVANSPFYQGHALDHMNSVWDFWHDLEHALRGRKGASTFSPDATRTRDHAEFILAMQSYAMAGRAAELAARADLTGRKTLLDVGGGPGTYSMALCHRFPQLHATVFDVPPTIAIARQAIAQRGFADRVATLIGDWDTDDFPDGHDALLMSNVLHGPSSNAEMKLHKARRCLSPGGLLILQDFLLNDEKTGPLVPALFTIMVGAYSLPELLALVAAAGFTSISHQPMPRESGQTLITARKP